MRAYASGFADVRKTGRGIILCGGVGTGKTHLAVGVIRQVTAAGFTALYAVLLDSFRSIKDTYRKDSSVTETAAMARLTAPDLLVLDEIGVQHGTDTERMLMFSILNERYNQMNPTILISNLAREPLEKYLGERAFDRMREGGGRMVVFDWESYRGAPA
ncbi:DNA replication protein DnaC [compost metagenome]